MSVPIYVTSSGIITLDNNSQFQNIPHSIPVILCGIFTDVKDIQLKNAWLPMSVTVSGISTDSNSVQSRKASDCIVSI